MNTLVIFASKHGTVKKCASELSKRLTGSVELHDLRSGTVQEVDQYDNVVIGGSIYAGRIQKEVTEFCSQNLNLLGNKKLGLFICCMNKENALTQLNGSFPQELLNIASVKDSFGGELRFSDMNFAEKAITKMIARTMAKNDPGMSGRDLKQDISMIDDERIERFAQALNIA